MAEEAGKPEVKESVAQPAKTEVIPRSPTELGIDMIADEHAKLAVEDFGGLFTDEAKPSEDQLKQAEPEKATESSEKKDDGKPKSEAATPKPEDTKPKEEPKKPAKEEEAKKKEEEAKKPEKPPEGFVRKEALAETRAQLKSIKEELVKVKAQLADKPAVQPQKTADDAKWDKFKVLSDSEYDQMVEDDPIEAQKYTHRLHQYEKYQDQKSRAQAEAQQSKQKFQSLVDQTVTKIKEVVPGIYDEDSEVAGQLAEFAAQNGFDDDAYLDAMTNPATLIVPPGQDKSFILGPGAASLIKLLNTLRAKVGTASDPAKLREEIEKELEPKLREQITKEIVSKFKDAGPGKYKSLTEVPGSGEKPDITGKAMTEEEWARLSSEDRDKYLMAT